MEVAGKICALHVSQLFAKLSDFAEPMSWFSEGQVGAPKPVTMFAGGVCDKFSDGIRRNDAS